MLYAGNTPAPSCMHAYWPHGNTQLAFYKGSYRTKKKQGGRKRKQATPIEGSKGFQAARTLNAPPESDPGITDGPSASTSDLELAELMPMLDLLSSMKS
ncbi:hypothetical protein WJX74_006315 [Apatococcus lobatus]|uniref:Uncharacterized protein n=1 Tax=Apatococcus lobatus TaxID=904363 RepID=A0AAW1R2K4_9CHLO